MEKYIDVSFFATICHGYPEEYSKTIQDNISLLNRGEGIIDDIGISSPSQLKKLKKKHSDHSIYIICNIMRVNNDAIENKTNLVGGKSGNINSEYSGDVKNNNDNNNNNDFIENKTNLVEEKSGNINSEYSGDVNNNDKNNNNKEEKELTDKEKISEKYKMIILMTGKIQKLENNIDILVGMNMNKNK
jgi:hypothetical protein